MPRAVEGAHCRIAEQAMEFALPYGRRQVGMGRVGDITRAWTVAEAGTVAGTATGRVEASQR